MDQADGMGIGVAEPPFLVWTGLDWGKAARREGEKIVSMVSCNS